MILLLLACTGAVGDPEGTDPATCFDGEDNDLDGEIDCDDAGCDDQEDCQGVGSATGDIVINEFMASNQETIEEAGSFYDWIELWNAGDSTVDLQGWTITDDLSTPSKHTLASLTIEPGDFLLLWASDDEEEYGDAHLGFHLSIDGEDIGLYRPDGSASDTVEYEAQATDLSAARVPDGSSEWVITDDPTPGESNGD